MAHPSPTPHSQGVWILEMFTAGKLAVSAAGEPWRTFSRGEGVLYAPGTIYRERHVPGPVICESYCLMFVVEKGAFLDPWRALVGSHRGVEDPRGLLLPLVEQVLHHDQLPGPDALLAQGAFLQVIGHLLRAASRERWLTVTESRHHEDLLTRVHRFMRANLHKPLSIADFAEEMEMSVSGLAHAYKRLSGIAPMIELRRLRVEVAKSHLIAGRHSLAQIARLTGFADAFHLSRTFKKVTRQTPRDFRRKISEPAAPSRT